MFKTILILFLTLISLFGATSEREDSDNDLVPNSKDRCPNTPEGVFVTNDGCTKQIKKTVYFEHASFKLDQNDKIVLVLVAELIEGTKGYKIEVVGHTDSIADPKTNMLLSQKRAQSVTNFLINSQIKKEIISTKWYGETRPVASNITSEGRSKNRRVSIILK